MGKGKGDLQGYEVVVKPGRIIFEIDGVSDQAAVTALSKASAKLPFKTKVINLI
jgi:large subunit ribosomal protein L16